MSQAIVVDLPARVTILELAMTSPTEGWLVGAVFAPDHRTVQSGLIMRYRDQEWRPVDDPLPVAFIDGIAMVSADEGWVTGRFEAAWSAGSMLSWEQILAVALTDALPAPSDDSQPVATLPPKPGVTPGDPVAVGQRAVRFPAPPLPPMPR